MPSLINLWFVCNSLSIYKLSILYCTIRLFKKDNYDNGDADRLFSERSGRRGAATLQVLTISTKAREPADCADWAVGPLGRGLNRGGPGDRGHQPRGPNAQTRITYNVNRIPTGTGRRLGHRWGATSCTRRRRSEIQPSGHGRCS